MDMDKTATVTAGAFTWADLNKDPKAVLGDKATPPTTNSMMQGCLDLATDLFGRLDNLSRAVEVPPSVNPGAGHMDLTESLNTRMMFLCDVLRGCSLYLGQIESAMGVEVEIKSNGPD